MITKSKHDGYIQISDENIEDYQTKFQWIEKDGIIVFPFEYFKTSGLDRCYCLIKKKRKYVKKVETEEPSFILPLKN